METLIEKSIKFTFLDILAPVSILSIPIVFLIVFSVHTWIQNKKIDKMIDKDIKVPSEPLAEAILIGIAVAGPIILACLVHTYVQPTYGKSAQLTEIKEHIVVNNDKLTIKSLPEPYHYKNNKLNNASSHDFKITKNNFYNDANPKLVDKDGNQYEITNDELNQLKNNS